MKTITTKTKLCFVTSLRIFFKHKKANKILLLSFLNFSIKFQCEKYVYRVTSKHDWQIPCPNLKKFLDEKGIQQKFVQFSIAILYQNKKFFLGYFSNNFQISYCFCNCLMNVAIISSMNFILFCILFPRVFYNFFWKYLYFP